MKNTYKVLIIIPAFNEEDSIRRVVEKIRKMHPDVSVLVVNDGSSDETSSEAYAAGARVVTLPYNLGIGGAVQTGYKVAFKEDYDIAVQIDGDGQHDPAYLNALIKPVRSGELDMCIGSRFLDESDTGFKSTFMRRIGIQLFVKLLDSLIQVKLTDPTSGFRAINRMLIEKFAESYPIDFPEPEAIKHAQRYGAKIGEMPVTMKVRLGGQSSIRYFKTAYYMIKVTLAILIDTLRETK